MTTADMLALLDDAWDHRWESMAHALKDLTPEEAAFQHPAYAAEPREADMPPPGTVLWHLAHVAHCDRFYAKMIRRRPNKPEPTDAPGWLTLEACRAALAEQRNALRSAVAELPDGCGKDLVGNGKPIEDFIRACARHVAWHGAQVAVARRLWRTR